MDKESLFFAISHWGEFGQIRYQAALSAGEVRRIPIVVPSGRHWVIVKYRFGDIQADVINFTFEDVRNYFEQNILIGTELLNFVVEPHPPLVAIGSSGEIVVENTDVVARDFSIVLDFVVLTDEIDGHIRELVLGSREKARGAVTKLAGTGGA